MCFGSAFFADPDPGKNLNVDPYTDPDPGGNGKKCLVFYFFTFQMTLNNFKKN